MNSMSSRQFDIAFEIWSPQAGSKDWQIVVDRKVLGKYRRQLDAIESAKTLAREAWQEAALRTTVIEFKPDGRQHTIARFDDDSG